MPSAPQVKQPPRLGLWIMQIKIGEELVIRKFKQTRSIVTHPIKNPRQEIMDRDITEVALVMALQPEEGGGRSQGGSGTLALPELGGCVVMEGVDSVLSQI